MLWRQRITDYFCVTCYATHMNDYSLTPTQLKSLRKAHRREPSKMKADKIKAVYLLGSGWSVSSICEALMLDDNTVYRYYDAYKSSGIIGMTKVRHLGSEIKLTHVELEQLEEHLGASPCRTTKQVIDYVEQEYEVTYSISGMNSLLKRLGFVFKKPRPVPGKYNAAEQQSFLEKYAKVRANMTNEDSLFFMDGVHPHHNPLVQYGWFKKGSKQPLRTNTRYQRINITGAVDIDTLDVVYQDSKRLNEESTLDFLEKLRKKRPKGWIYLVLDNAGYHKTPRIKAFSEAVGIKLLYLPPYSPNLNLIERLWGKMQKDVLYNHYYPSFEGFKEACLNFLRRLRWRKHELNRLLTEKFEKLPC